MRKSFAVSSIVHMAFLIVVISPGFHSRRQHIVEVINVRLVGEEKKQEPKAVAKEVKPPAPQPQPEKKTEKSEMAYETKTKKRETKEEVKPAPKKPEETPAPKPKTPDPEPAREESPTQAAQPCTR